MKLPAIRWLAEPTRFAALGRARARIALAVLGLFLLLSLTALVTAGPPPVSGDPAKRADDQSDVVLYESIVAGVRHGGGYYEVAADALRAGNYPLRPFVTFRLPGLAMVQAHLPRLATMGLLYLLVASVFAVWGSRLRAGMTRWPPVAIGLALLAAGLMAFVQPDLWAFHEIWAGLLVALSLGIRRQGRWIEAVGIALLAMLIRETAALFALVMLAAAWLEGQKREAIGWGAAIACLAVALGFHAWAVGQVTTAADPASPGWAGAARLWLLRQGDGAVDRAATPADGARGTARHAVAVRLDRLEGPGRRPRRRHARRLRTGDRAVRPAGHFLLGAHGRAALADRTRLRARRAARPVPPGARQA